MTDAPLSKIDNEHFKWYQAYRFGDLISEGPTPMPDDILDQVTEIRWSMGDESPTPPPAQSEPSSIDGEEPPQMV